MSILSCTLVIKITDHIEKVKKESVPERQALPLLTRLMVLVHIGRNFRKIPSKRWWFFTQCAVKLWCPVLSTGESLRGQGEAGYIEVRSLILHKFSTKILSLTPDATILPQLSVLQGNATTGFPHFPS